MEIFLRKRVLRLFIRGQLASLEEGAIIAGVSRMTLWHWLKRRKIDWRLQRTRYLVRQRRRLLGERELSKAELRAIAESVQQQLKQRHGLELGEK